VSPLRPVSEEPDGPVGPKGGAEVVTRVVTGVLIAAGCLLLLNAGRAPSTGLVAAVVGLGVMELSHALRSQRPAVVIALAGSVALVVGAYRWGEAAFPALIGLVAVSTLLWFLAPVGRGRPVAGVSATFLVFAYVGVLGGFAGLLLSFPNGVGLLLGLAVCSVSYDVCGYFAGSRLGRHKLAPSISPNKTVEGLLAGMAGSVVFAVVVVSQITPWDTLSALALGTVAAIMAPLGDLCESLLKRDLGVKDLGGLFPGHGGVLDRFDAILFALPAVYYLAKVLELS
jgi:phosphatidate cytidylyltransferase